MLRSIFAIMVLCGLPFAQTHCQEWVKEGAGREEYVRDRTECVQQGQAMALAGDELQRDLADCLAHRGWQRNQDNTILKPYCFEKETIKACKPGGTADSYKVDRAQCWDHVLATVGNNYSIPGWVGVGGLIDSKVTAARNKRNLERTQLSAMKICLEGRNWAVEWKGHAAEVAAPGK